MYESSSLIPQLDPQVQALQNRARQMTAAGIQGLAQIGQSFQQRDLLRNFQPNDLQFSAPQGSEWKGPTPPPDWSSIQRGIFAGESGGDYDALFGYSNRGDGKFAGTKLTDMTVDDAIRFSDPKGQYGQWVKGQIGRVATPMGAYQIVGTTLRHAKEGLGLTGNERMTRELQDALGYWIYQQQGTGAWEGYKGPIG